MRNVFFIQLILFNFLSAFAQTGIQKAIDRFVAVPNLRHASVSVSVVDTKNGQLIASHDSHRSLAPASSLKVITTATALAVLGADYRFKTELLYDGYINSEGVLQGNIYIKGYGDPTLGSDQWDAAPDADAVLAQWVAAIKTAGIKAIKGRIIGDASEFDTAADGRSWPWEDLGNYYGAGAWALNFHENLYYLDFLQQGQIGTIPPIKQIRPEIPNLLIINEVRSKERGSGDNAYLFGGPYSYTRFVRGTIPIGQSTFTIKGSIPDPPFFAAHSLHQQLIQSGLRITQPASTMQEMSREGAAPGKLQSIHRMQSPPLREIVHQANQESINLYCESLLKAIGKAVKGEGSYTAGLEAVYDFWKTKGLNTEGFHMIDGSGLAPKNAVSSYHLAKVLHLSAKDKAIFPHFEPSLPLAAKTGTARHMFKGSVAAGKLRAKSGAIERVRSYTGYAPAAAGGRLAFSILVSNYTGEARPLRRQMEQLMVAFCK